MAKIRTQLLYAVLLVAPLLATAGFALRLLANEERRLEEASLKATSEHAEFLAGTIGFAVAETKSELLESLAKLPEKNLAEEMRLWQEGSPFVRGTLVCTPDGRIEATTGSLETLEVFSENGSFVWRTRENSPVQSDSPPDRSGSGSPQPAIRNLKQQAAWRAKLEFMQRMQPQFG